MKVLFSVFIWFLKIYCFIIISYQISRISTEDIWGESPSRGHRWLGIVCSREGEMEGDRGVTRGLWEVWGRSQQRGRRHRWDTADTETTQDHHPLSGLGQWMDDTGCSIHQVKLQHSAVTRTTEHVSKVMSELKDDSLSRRRWWKIEEQFILRKDEELNYHFVWVIDVLVWWGVQLFSIPASL